MQAAMENLEEKLKGSSDNPFESAANAQEAIGLAEKLCESTENDT